jgi:hypothetical protein
MRAMIFGEPPVFERLLALEHRVDAVGGQHPRPEPQNGPDRKPSNQRPGEHRQEDCRSRAATVRRAGAAQGHPPASARGPHRLPRPGPRGPGHADALDGQFQAFRATPGPAATPRRKAGVSPTAIASAFAASPERQAMHMWATLTSNPWFDIALATGSRQPESDRKCLTAVGEPCT